MKTLFVMAVALIVSASAYGQSPPPNPKPVAAKPTSSRFQLERTQSGVVRLDTETGVMTLCRDENGALSCRMESDERPAYEQKLDRLEKRVTVLEERLSHIPPNTLPTDAEIDRSLSIMERFMRTFMGIIGEFADEREAAKPQPDRT